MDYAKQIRKNNFLKRLHANILIVVSWICGIVFSYFLYALINNDYVIQNQKLCFETILTLCILALIVSCVMFYCLFNHTYERRQIERNIRASNYISAGLELLNERFVLIDVKNESYEFLYTNTENEHVMKIGPYPEFVTYLLDAVANDLEREKLKNCLELPNLIRCLTTNKRILCIPVELNINHVIRWDLLSFISVEENGKGICKILISRRDITEAQNKEVSHYRQLADALDAAEQANKAKSTFLFNMSHDIRTPMNAIIGFTSLARKHINETKKATDYLNKVEMSSQHMLQIINDILDMARIDSGKVELETGPINIYKEFHVTDALFRSSMEEKQIHFQTEIHVTDEIVQGDAMRIKQIVINLVSNAMKYTKPGGNVTLSYLQTGQDESGLARFRIIVKDTGIGMSEEYQYHLFEAFERERNATVSGIQGTGLGLAISKQLADLMGGTLTCTSKLGVGTEFVFEFQLPIVGQMNKKTNDITKNTMFRGKRILLVEDNDLNREIAVELLEELGLVVEEANDGSVAVEMIQNAPENYYHLIFMDIQMPYMDGYQATKMIRMRKDSGYSQIPIVAMTANAFREDCTKALNAGMNAHLSKPFDEQKIIHTLQKFL